jgi:hypothetical protein
MKRRTSSYLYFLTAIGALMLGACGDDTGKMPIYDASISETGTSVSAIDGSAGLPSGIVVLSSDYQTSAVSILDREGTLVIDNCFNSNTGPNGISLTLSGDLALPTQSAIGDAVVILDRGNSVLTWLDPPTCAPLRQLAVGTGFVSDPHDYVALSATKAYVVRYNQNAAATLATGDFDDGNDLLIIDPTQPKIVGRIDLKPFAPVGVLPDADRAMLIDGKVYVSLNAISENFKTYGAGRIVIVDPAQDQVVGTIDLPGVKNCGALTYLPAEKKLLVACTGDYGAGDQQFQGSAIVAIDVSSTPPMVVGQVAAAAVGAVAFANSTLAAFDSNTILGVQLGDFSNTPPDKVWTVSLAGTQPTKLFDSTEGITIGTILVDSARPRVFIADGTTTSVGLIREFDLVSGSLVAGKATAANPSHSLPPRALAWY